MSQSIESPTFRSPTGGLHDRGTVTQSQALAPLLEQLRHYDLLRLRLEQHGGRLGDLRAITAALTAKIHLEGYYREHEFCLSDQVELRQALWNVGNCDVHLDIRQLGTRMPVYYLCRIRQDYWSEYSLVVEDLYRSPGYPMVDERFVRLMEAGHERYFLRLSQFRSGLLPMGDHPHAGARLDVDGLLYRLGRHIFQAAWHEDQRPGILAAEHFGLPHFRGAIELLYLCLSGELCELRGAVNEEMLGFLETVYPQPAIHAFLQRLRILDGSALSEIPQAALRCYTRLSREFGRFVEVEVVWGHRRTRVPLYKLLFGNLGRLELVAQPLRLEEPVARAIARLETESQTITNQITGDQVEAPQEVVSS